MTPLIYAGLSPLSRFGFLNRAKDPIINIVCKALSIDREQLISKKRTYKLVAARFLVSHFIRKYTKMTLAEIGAMIGGRDHSTVIYQIDQYPLRMSMRISLGGMQIKLN